MTRLGLSLLLANQLSSCGLDCGLDGKSFSLNGCRSLNSTYTKSQVAGFGACNLATNSRKVELLCSANSGSNGACTSRSNRSGYFVVLVPNNASGNFRDANYSDALGNGIIQGCDALWNAMSLPGGQSPSQVAGVYHGDPDTNDFVTCTDSGGCMVTSPNCFSSWDYTNSTATGVTASIPDGGYLACAFIDSPYLNGIGTQGAPPQVGVPAGLVASSTPDNFVSVSLHHPVTNPIVFNSWVNYQSGTDRCSATTNSRKINVSCTSAMGSSNTCSATANSSGYFVVVVPDNGSGQFNDSNYSVTQGHGVITNCAQLWAALGGVDGQRPSDIVGYYHADPGANDMLSCDSNGCSSNSLDCFSAWDVTNEIPSGNAAVIPSAGPGTYLACAFLDTPWNDSTTPAQGAPPTTGHGLLAPSASTVFTSVSFGGGQTPLGLSNWVDY